MIVRRTATYPPDGDGRPRRATRMALPLALAMSVGAAWPGPSVAEGVPRHLSSMAGQLLKATRDQLASPAGDASHAWAVTRAYRSLKDIQVYRWRARPHKQAGLAAKVGAAVGLSEVGPDDRPRLQKLIDTATRGEPDKAIREFNESYGRPAPTKEEMTNLRRKLDEAFAGAWKDLARSHTIEQDDGRRRISFDWVPELSRFSVGISDDGTDYLAPYHTTISGEVTTRVNDESGGVALAVAPVEAPVLALDGHDLASLDMTVFGEWRDGDDDTWLIMPVDPRDADRPKPKETRAASIADQVRDKESRIAEIKKSRVFVWENSETGESKEQKRFRRLKQPFWFVGQSYASEGAEAEIERLKSEIAELADAREKPRTTEYDPTGFKEAERSGRQRGLRIEVTESSGLTYTYDDAHIQLNAIRARRTLRDERDIRRSLPSDVVKQLIESWDPPEWINLIIRRNARTGELRLDGQRWRLHVTYDPRKRNEIKRIHTPYPMSFALTRAPRKAP